MAITEEEKAAAIALLVDEDCPDPHVPFRFMVQGDELFCEHRKEQDEEVYVWTREEGWQWRERVETPVADPEAMLAHWWRLVRMLYRRRFKGVQELPHEADREGRGVFKRDGSAWNHAKALAVRHQEKLRKLEAMATGESDEDDLEEAGAP